MTNFVKFVFKKEFEKLKKDRKELASVEMGDVYDLEDGGYRMDVKYGANDWEELNMAMCRTHVKPFEVHGGIAKVWRSEGGTKGRLGYPISNEEPLSRDPSNAAGGDCISIFEHGSIIWYGNESRLEVVYDEPTKGRV